jgi:hypothetical protein
VVPFGPKEKGQATDRDNTAEVEAPNYRGPERRVRAPQGRRGFRDHLASNLGLVTVVVGLGLSVLSAGIAWGVTQQTLRNLDAAKVSRDEWLTKNAAQDRDNNELLRQLLALKYSVDELTPAVRDVAARIRDMNCEGKGPSCR